jgi:UDP-3-O-[3-hydroxymyristoyl] glucosamine N-acyltransferase
MTAKDIADALGQARLTGNADQPVEKVVQLDPFNISAECLSWCSDTNREMLRNVAAGTIICSTSISRQEMNQGCTYIMVDNPRLAFMKVVTEFFVDRNIDYRIEDTARIHPSAKISSNVKIGHNVVIEEDVEVGEHTIINSNTVIHGGTRIGRKVKIGANTTIGGVGFGYEKDEQGNFTFIPHLGNVVIEDLVEIGNNTTIDRAVLGSTILRRNVKVDNLVHIAHGVEVGENSLIIANAMVAGSVKIGRNAWVAPSASILNKKSIGEDAVIGMGAVVLKDVAAGDVVAGSPARSIKDRT